MRICHRESKKGNSKRKRNLSYSKITDAESLAYTHSPIGSGGTDWKLLFLGTSNHLEGLSEGEASARGGDGAAEFFGGFNPFLNDDFDVRELALDSGAV